MEWISVEDKPVPIGVRVMLWFITVGDNHLNDGITIGKASLHETGQFWDDSGMYRPLDRISHWMPLPQEPTK